MNRHYVQQRLLILSAHDSMQRVNDTAYPFAQESYVLWLTGIHYPGWKVVIDGSQKKSWLIAPSVDQTHRLFDGALDHQTARHQSGADEVLSFEEGERLIKQLANQHDTVYSLGAHPSERHFSFEVNPAPARLWSQLEGLFKEVKDCRAELAVVRAIKTDDEIKDLKQAVALSIRGFRAVQSSLASTTHEYQIEAALSHIFRGAGSMGHAYDPIVASGGNACTLHYVQNNDPLPQNGLVLIDAGARVNGYCADITRTYAIGSPTERQKAVHAAVEKAHHAIIALLGPEKSVKEYHQEVDEIMIEALKSLGLYEKPEDYRKYFPHAISHGLGIDVHDPLGNPTHFKPGTVLTVEPGIYIPEEGIGVRIEDDILITESGVENLSGALPTSL